MKKEILNCAKMAKRGGVLDKEVQDGQFLQAIENKDIDSIQAYLDLPISEIHALDRRDFLKLGVTWRESVNGLHCEGWNNVRDSVAEYFTSDLYDTPFPTPGSERELKIGFAGGAPYCILGNHRLSAGKAWLAYNIGEKAIFKKVNCIYRPIKPGIKAILQSCLNQDSVLKYYHVPWQECLGRYKFFDKEGFRNFIRIDSANEKTKLYVFGEGWDVKEIPYTIPFVPRFFRFDMYSLSIRLNYKTIPRFLIKQILDESIVQPSFKLI
ncbi:hypothetical protein [Pseudoalteromonas piscicida]